MPSTLPRHTKNNMQYMCSRTAGARDWTDDGALVRVGVCWCVLVRAGASSQGGYSPLYLACQGGHDSVVTSLIALGSDVNQCDEVRSVIGNEDDGRAYSKEFAAVLGTDLDDFPRVATPGRVHTATHRHSKRPQRSRAGSCISWWKPGPACGGSVGCIACCLYARRLVLMLRCVSLVSQDGWTPLHVACANGRYAPRHVGGAVLMRPRLRLRGHRCLCA